MHKLNWPGLQRHRTRHKKIVWYVRVDKGPRRRLKSEPGTPAFREEYEQVYAVLLKGDKPKSATTATGSKGTLKWLWEQYCKSSSWTALELSTRRQRENIMKRVLKNGSHAPIEKITRSQIIDGREERKETPSAAKNYIATLRSLFDWAVDAEHMKSNPCDGVKRIKAPKSNGFPEWDDGDVAKFVARWPLGTRQYLALAVHLNTGLRRGDAVRLGKQHFKKTVIYIKSAEKNGAELTIPIHPDLIEAIKACPPTGLHILETSMGKPWVKESYGNTFLEWTKAAGIYEEGTNRTKNSHGIRKLAATRVAEAGASEHELMALFGWTDPKMARHYTKSANAKKLAERAGARVGAGADVLDLFGDPSLIPDVSENG